MNSNWLNKWAHCVFLAHFFSNLYPLHLFYMDNILFILGVTVSLTFFFLFVYIFCEFDPAFFSNSIFHRHSDVDDTDVVKKKKTKCIVCRMSLSLSKETELWSL